MLGTSKRGLEKNWEGGGERGDWFLPEVGELFLRQEVVNMYQWAGGKGWGEGTGRIPKFPKRGQKSHDLGVLLKQGSTWKISKKWEKTQNSNARANGERGKTMLRGPATTPGQN